MAVETGLTLDDVDEGELVAIQKHLQERAEWQQFLAELSGAIPAAVYATSEKRSYSPADLMPSMIKRRQIAAATEATQTWGQMTAAMKAASDAADGDGVATDEPKSR